MYQLDNNGSGEVLRPKLDSAQATAYERWSEVFRASSRVHENPDIIADNQRKEKARFNQNIARMEQAAVPPSGEVVEHSIQQIMQRVEEARGETA